MYFSKYLFQSDKFKRYDRIIIKNILIDKFGKFEFEFINQQRNMQKSKFFPENLRTSTSVNNFYDEDCIREAPQKIGHNKFTKTFSKLQSIPREGQILNLIPRHIQHLYLSHNKIKSLKGIEQYIHIKSLNVSYNSLCQIEELQLFKNPQNMVRIGLKMNSFVYGYQDYVISKFQNLKKIDDLQIGSREKVKEMQTRGQNIANFVLEYYLRMNRILFFMDDLIQKKMLHQQLRFKNKNAQEKSQRSNLKLLFENMSEDFLANVSSLYIFPTEQEFRNLSSMQILVKIQKIIYLCLTQGVDLKCSCRPRMSVNDEIKQTFKQISSKFLLRFSSRFNTQIQRGLSIIEQKIKVLHPSRQFQKWQLFGMLQNYYTLKSGGVRYKNIVDQNNPRYSQLIGQKINAKSSKNTMKNDLSKFISSKGQSDKQNLNPNKGMNHYKNTLIQNEQLRDQETVLDDQTIQKRITWISGEKQNGFKQKNKKHLTLQFFYERIPIFIFQKNYIEVMLQIVCQKVKQMLTKYDLLSDQILKIKDNNQKYHSAIYTNQTYLDNFYDKCSKINFDLQVQKYPGTFNDIKEQKMNQKNENKHNTSRETSSPLKTQRKNIKKYLGQQKVTNSQAMLKSTLVNNSPSHLQEGFESGAITTYRPLLQRKDSQISFGLANQEKQQQDYQLNRQIKYQTHSNYEQKLKNNKSSEFLLFSQTNYEIHQINLIYKVFRSLRHRVVKKRKRKTTEIPNNN